MFYRLWIVDNDGEQRFSMRNDFKENLEIVAEAWLRCMMIQSYYITEHEENS